ncbi:lipase family protein [Mycolicibacterium sp. 050232]|uniref:lipase family protein n=1 Tax=Mycolicibacterium sp. 050232 TaxID=3113982 RepID=UPI002E280AFF|nr:lipase family protein [Mycolicibacterium sp. 050232]MED5814334.1 lipase family protein [Mycolicibacterium sp. 050232]
MSVDEQARYAPELVQAAGDVKRAVYRSTSGVTGRPVNVGGVFAVPKGAPPEGGWPVVSVGHATTGLDHGCGPSLRPDLMGYTSTVTGLLAKGFAVAMSDYEGLDDEGTHAYLEPYSAAYNLIDATRAVARLFPDVSSNWAALGGSQGGQSAWSANEMADTYGDGLKMVGAAAEAPPVNIADLAERAYLGQLTPEQQGVWPMVIVGVQRVGLLPNTTPYLRGAADPTAPGFLGCEEQDTWLRSGLNIDDMRPETAEDTQKLERALQLIALPQRPLAAPMLVINGAKDQVVFPSWVAYSVRLSCRLGGDIRHVELPQADHDNGYPDEEVLIWLAKRFAGEPAESNCGSDSSGS